MISAGVFSQILERIPLWMPSSFFQELFQKLLELLQRSFQVFLHKLSSSKSTPEISLDIFTKVSPRSLDIFQKHPPETSKDIILEIYPKHPRSPVNKFSD